MMPPWKNTDKINGGLSDHTPQRSTKRALFVYEIRHAIGERAKGVFSGKIALTVVKY
jgi:hypothetical protein